MPPSFPSDEFRAFGVAAATFFPKLLSDEDLNDPLERRRHFDWSRQAVSYRYRSCAECNDEFKALLNNKSAMWRAGSGDEELTYKLERCIYVFFMSALSVFESFGFCVYFLGGALRPETFPHINTPQKVTLATTSKAFTAAFPNAAITGTLAALLQKPEFTTIVEIRNLLAHRLSGRLSVLEWGDGTTHSRKENWHIPGLAEGLEFGDNMLAHRLAQITDMLTALTVAAREFAESQKSTKGPP